MSEELKVGDNVLLKDKSVVEITEIRDKRRYAYPIWHRNVRTSLPNGCKFVDILKLLTRKGARGKE